MAELILKNPERTISCLGAVIVRGGIISGAPAQLRTHTLLPGYIKGLRRGKVRSEQTLAIISLHKAGEANKEMANIVDASLQSRGFRSGG